MPNETDVVVVEDSRGLMASAVRPGEIVRLIKHVHDIAKDAMTEAVVRDGKIVKEGDYGLIPGCGDKPAIRKSGAEKLLLGFGLVGVAREPRIVDLGNGHREVFVETEIKNLASGKVHAIGIGSCSTMESKYRWRNSERICPQCSQPAIIKGKKEYGGGWLCFKKKNGCGAKFKDGDATIEGQQVGKEENPDIADSYNTVLKIAGKRSMVDGTLRATASSAMFTQDVDEGVTVNYDAPPAPVTPPERPVTPPVAPEPPESVPDAPVEESAPYDEEIPPPEESGVEPPLPPQTVIEKKLRDFPEGKRNGMYKKLRVRREESKLDSKDVKEFAILKWKKDSMADLTQAEYDVVVSWLDACIAEGGNEPGKPSVMPNEFPSTASSSEDF
jgi:hypothetical protein